jgi:carbon monoxide dehydrogenase subunit G
MAQMMPGVESFDIQDDRHWRANVKVPLGLGGLKMSIDFEKIEEREPEFAKLHAKGNGVGAIMNMDTAFHLADAGGGTRMKWEADVHILGPVASMGQRVLQPIVNQQVSNVLSSLDKQVQEAAGGTADPGVKDAGEPAEGPAEPEGSSGAEEGLSPLAPESYEPEPEGPTTSTT